MGRQSSGGSDSDDLEEQLQTARSIGSLINAAPTIETPPGREDFAVVIGACIDAATNGDVAQLARFIEVPYNTVSNWKHGNSIPTIEHFLNICDRLCIPPQRMVEHNGSAIRTALESTEITVDLTTSDRRGNRVDMQKTRRELVAIVAAEDVPPPSLALVAGDLGYDFSTIKRCFPKLSQRISQRYWAHRRDTRARARKILEDALRDERQPPLSFTDVCHCNGLSRRRMYEWFPEVSHSIAARYEAYLSRLAELRKETIRSKVFDAVSSLYKSGEIPTMSKVFSAINDPICFPMDPTFRVAFNDAIRELDIG